jgi:hypothetical protein
MAMPSDVVNLPPVPKLLDFPASIGLTVAVALTTVLLIVSSKFDPSGGSLTISLLVVLVFIAATTFCLFFTVPNDEITAGVLGGLITAFGAVVSHWLGKAK